ncbi:MAG: hypothetical protein ACOZQL_19470 [Myxococcota bacterium]
MHFELGDPLTRDASVWTWPVAKADPRRIVVVFERGVVRELDCGLDVDE